MSGFEEGLIRIAAGVTALTIIATFLGLLFSRAWRIVRQVADIRNAIVSMNEKMARVEEKLDNHTHS